MNCLAAAAFCLVTGEETDTSCPESSPNRSAFKFRAPNLTVPSPPSILKSRPTSIYREPPNKISQSRKNEPLNGTLEFSNSQTKQRYRESKGYLSVWPDYIYACNYMYNDYLAEQSYSYLWLLICRLINVFSLSEELSVIDAIVFLAWTGILEASLFFSFSFLFPLYIIISLFLIITRVSDFLDLC